MTYCSHCLHSYRPKKSPDLEYLSQIEMSKIDFTNRVDKRVNKVELPQGFYGYTFLGGGEMYINNKLLPEDNFKTQVHEAIHTDDEYETRRLEEWMTGMTEDKDSLEHKAKDTEKDYAIPKIPIPLRMPYYYRNAA
jgi:hypothetical protein